VVIGNIGTELRMDFACIGDAVNTASRLCSIAKPYEIIASKTLITETKKFFSFEELAPVKLKGKESPFEIVRIKW
jgi:Adenylate cyclase, family 3 (some proteins contain HAMP domain)